ncbi:MAG: Cupredoxin [Benjaminiella poitrasii]|nr:MAG: Cupredoxin [Benjaminiella poitrasii]
MRKVFFIILLIAHLVAAAVAAPAAASDYFDQLKEELEQTPTGQIRRFYITIEEDIWDYSSESVASASGNNIIGTKYYKALYHEYEDITYTKKKQKFHWQGNMGPILKVEVGDIIQIFFWNRASKTYTIHPHGIFYEFEMEGALFKGAYEESAVAPNQNFTYTWNVLPRAGPGPEDGDSIVWGYHSHVTENDIYAGLYGSIVVYRQGKLSQSANDIVTAVFGNARLCGGYSSMADETLSPYHNKTMTELYSTFDESKYSQDEIYKAKQFPSINGLISSSPSDLVFNDKDSVNWHLIGWGTYWDVENMKWENGKIINSNNPTAVSNNYVRLMPASFYGVTLKFDKNNGEYAFGSLDSKNNDSMSMKYKVAL